MKKVKIIKTTYGYRTPSGRLEPKDRHSEPFILDDSEADRLVSAGYAEIVGEGEKHVLVIDKPQAKKTPKKSKKSASEIGEYNEEMSMNDLIKVAKNAGINYKFGMTKMDLIDALDAGYAASIIPNAGAEDAIV